MARRQTVTRFSLPKSSLAAGSGDPCLVVIDGPRLGQCLHVHEVPAVIGRSPEADFQIEHASVSREHCSVWREGSEVYVRDLGSKNGTYVNDVRASKAAELGEGTHVALGEVVLKFVLGGTLEARYHEALYELATLDSLTQLNNRREFRDSLHEAVLRLKEHDESLSVAIFDLDHFKQINDILGHADGDAVLRRMAATLREKLRSGDVAGRLGGDEFAVLLRDADAQIAFEWCEDLRASMQGMGLEDRGLPEPVSISIGLATWTPEMESGRELLRLADMALLRAKDQGRNRVCAAAGPEEGALEPQSKQ